MMFIRYTPIYFVAITLFVMIGCGGCEGTNPIIESWDITDYTEFGRKPIWSPDGETVLFGNDSPGQAGLWLWAIRQSPVLLADDLPPHNWDYVWSNDGDKITFSSPGAYGDESTGIWVVDVAQRTGTKISDSGENPSWLYNDEFVAAEINDGNSEAVIVMIDVNSYEKTNFVTGIKPLCSPQDSSILYTDKEYSDNDRDGRLKMTSRLGVDTISGPGAIQWKWPRDGRSIICIINNYLNFPNSLTGYLVKYNQTESNWLADTLSDRAGYPSPDGSGNQIAFMRESNSRWVGLWINRNGNDVHIADYVMNPDFHPTEDKIAVNGSAGGIKILQRTR